MSSVTTSLSATFIVMVGIGFAILGMAGHMPHVLSVLPRALVQ